MCSFYSEIYGQFFRSSSRTGGVDLDSRYYGIDRAEAEHGEPSHPAAHSWYRRGQRHSHHSPLPEEEDKNASVLGKSTGKAVLLSSLTTMIGFGSMMVANHYGVFSLGWS